MTHRYVLELAHLSLASFLSDQKRKKQNPWEGVVISAMSKVPVWTNAEISSSDFAASHYETCCVNLVNVFVLCYS